MTSFFRLVGEVARAQAPRLFFKDAAPSFTFLHSPNVPSFADRPMTHIKQFVFVSGRMCVCHTNCVFFPRKSVHHWALENSLCDINLFLDLFSVCERPSLFLLVGHVRFDDDDEIIGCVLCTAERRGVPHQFNICQIYPFTHY